jgi:hypothetical protein
MTIKMLDRDIMPCWYEISWQENPPAIILRLHRDWLGSTTPISEESPVVADLRSTFELNQFGRDFSSDIGFGGKLRRLGEKGEFVEFATCLPVVKKSTGKPCRACKGSGETEFGDKCSSCRGSGKGHEYDHRESFSASATLNVLFGFLLFPDHETKAKNPQLLQIQTTTHSGVHGGSLSGFYSAPLVRWLTSLGHPTPIAEVTNAMVVAYGHMFGGLDPYEERECKATVDHEYGGLNITCPGDACGLHPHHNRITRQGLGYQFSCHNVDNPHQQLTLIAGLAALHDRARKEILT